MKSIIRTVIEATSCVLFPIIGMLMLWFGFAGHIQFGAEGTAEYYMGLRGWVFIAIAFFVGSQLFIGKSFKRRLIATISSFLGIMLSLLLIGNYIGLMSAIDGGFNPTLSAFHFLFSIDTSIYADITPGLNVKLIADSICYLIPAVIFLVLIMQMIYAGEADEFIKAFLEGIGVIVFMIVYSLVGGVPIDLGAPTSLVIMGFVL